MINHIEFPALDLVFEIDRVAFTVLGRDVYWYGILIGLGVFLAAWYGIRRIDDFGFTADLVYDVLIWALPSAIVGARLYYVIFEWSYYSQHPADIIAVWKGGLAIYGGVIGALIAVAICCRKYRLNIASAFDVASLGLLIGQIIGRWGNFFNSEAYGLVTTAEKLTAQGIPKFIIDGMYILGEYRQPTFFYESVWCLVGFLALLIVRKCKYLKRGQLTGFYLIWYGIARFIIEALRTDSLMLGSLKMAQIVSVLFIITGMILFLYNVVKSTKEDQKLYREDLTPIDENEGFITYYKKRGDKYV